MHSILKFLYAFLSGAQLQVAWQMSNWYWGGSVDFLRQLWIKEGALSLRKGDCSFPVRFLGLFYPRLDWMQWLMTHHSFYNQQTNGSDLLVIYFQRNPDIVLPIRSHFDVLVLVEIDKSGDYHWIPSQPTVLLDWGANHGLYSVIAGSSGNFTKIYAFELVPETYHHALANINYNPSISSKISVQNKAVGGYPRFVSVGGFAAGSVQANIFAASNTGQQIEVLVAGSLLKEIASENPGYPVFLKMDIEGAELEVLESLVEHQSIQLLSAMVMECHNGLEKPIITLLGNNGFCCRLSPSREAAGTTLLFAHRYI